MTSLVACTLMSHTLLLFIAKATCSLLLFAVIAHTVFLSVSAAQHNCISKTFLGNLLYGSGGLTFNST